MMVFKRIFIFLAWGLVVFLSACGGGGGSDSSVAMTTRTLGGVIEDGPVAGAKVFLTDRLSGEVVRVCGPLGAGRCETTSGLQGGFSFEIDSGASLEELVVSSLGGADTGTGVDFSGLEMRAPLALFAGAEQDVAVTPITTLCAGGFALLQSPEETLEQVRTWLGLDAGVPLTGRPSEHPELLRRALLLTKLAMEKRRLGEKAPFSGLADQAYQGRLVDETGALDSSTLGQFDFPEQVKASIQSLQQTLWQDGQQRLEERFKRAEVGEAIAGFLARMFEGDEQFDSQNEDFQRNLAILVDQGLAAVRGSLPLGGLVPTRMARYILHSYGPETVDWSYLTASPETFAAALVHKDSGLSLAEDDYVDELIAIAAPNVVALPLLEDELLGDDNQRRAAYYFNSDVSHLYLAESLIGSVFDDTVGDSVMLEVAKGKAQSGLFAEARAIINTQIFQSELRAEAFSEIAYTLLEFGLAQDARDALLEAETLFRKVYDLKILSGLSISETLHLQSLGARFRRAGDFEGAQRIYDYLWEIAQAQQSTSLYSRVVAGTWQIADEYLEEGNLTEAAPLVDSLYDLALATPANEKSGKLYYKAKVLYLIRAAERYALLEDFAKVGQIHELIQSIRAKDGLENLTEGETWVYIPNLVEVLYRIGESDEALSLANSIPDTYLNYLGSEKSAVTYQAKAIKLVATYEAVNFGVEGALALVEERLDEVKDHIDALTYFATNQNVPYIALSLIDDGQLEAARQALAAAVALVDGLEEATDKDIYRYQIERGYVKLAGLYHLAGDAVQAEALLERAEPIAQALTGAEYQVDALVDLALGYQQIGRTATAAVLLWQAKQQADSAGGSLAADDAADLYEPVIEGFVEMEDFTAAEAVLTSYVHELQGIFEQTLSYQGNDHDTLASKEVDYLLKAADYYTTLGLYSQARGILDGARLTADQIYVEADRIAKYTHGSKNDLVEGYANAGDFDGALALAEAIPYLSDRYAAIGGIAEVYTGWDRFTTSWVASVDSDGDGAPDFFHPLATQEDIDASGLVLDLDSDGDGILDSEDYRPLYVD